MKQVFLAHLANIEKQVKDSLLQKSPAMNLYKAGARTQFFYLQALGRMFKSFHNKKKFTKLQEHCKAIEDGLGQVDFYYVAVQKFSSTSVEAKKYLSDKLAAAEKNLNDLLIKNKWNSTRVSKLKSKLNDCDWQTDGFYKNEIERLYKSEVAEIIEFGKSFNNQFSEFETQIHELRRKIRWLSIYPAALSGYFQLKPQKDFENVSVYQTDEVLNSPFNQFKNINKREIVYFNKQNFMALSWMILALGKIKDYGLDIHLISEIEKAIGKKIQYKLEFTAKDLLKEATDEWQFFLKTKAIENLIAK